MTINKYGDAAISPRTNVYAAAKMLSHAGPVLVLDKTGPEAAELPANATDTVKFRRCVPFDAATTPLTEGVSPTAKSLSFEDTSVALKQYGEVYIVTDKIADTHEDPVINKASMLCGENIGRTSEALNYGVLKAGTTVFYSNGASRAVVNTPISLAKQRAITRSLKAQKAQKIRNVLAPSPNYETRAVEASFIAVAHTDLENDIRGLPGFTPCAEYGTRDMICPDEIGKVDDVRYLLSADLDPFQAAGSATLNGMVADDSTNVDVYPVLYFGREAWGTVALKGQGAVKVNIIPPDAQSKSDPLNQRGYVGWKMYHAALILNQNWMARLEVAATDL